MKYRRAQSGVALVITLIMLTVITLITVAFLLLSQRERASVSSAITATDAELMVNAALDRTKAHVLAQMSSFISTNTNAFGVFDRLALGPDITVSVAGIGITNYPTPADYPALTNWFFDPSPPVFLRNGGVWQSVHYLDLNRNRVFDETGNVEVRDNNGNPITGRTNFVIGDPQWIGLPSRPNEPHSSNNRFVGRYAYLIIPVGRTADIGSIHNAAANGLFDRNQGHGSWEINLAAFLTDLNTNFWRNYDYTTVAGEGFLDATNVLAYRYAAANLPTAQQVFGTNTDLFASDGIDQYGDDSDNLLTIWSTRPWPGAPNRQHFFSIHDFFNGKTPTLQNRLLSAGLSLNSHDRHTFYRMLAQLGMDSSPQKRTYFETNRADRGPINLNYRNVKYWPGNEVTPHDFSLWTPEEFLQVTADRIFRDHGFLDHTGTNFLSVTGLQVSPTNFYTPAVHRILQMTLNIYDATTAQLGPAPDELPHYPTVLQPRFSKAGGNLTITGYHRFTHTGILNPSRWHDPNEAMTSSTFASDDFVYGVPVLLGAKKGSPNFNEMVVQSTTQFERKLEVEKSNGKTVRTNQLFLIGISNYVAVEAWNSYSNPYPRDLRLYVGITNRITLTNEEPYRKSEPYGLITQITNGPNMWQGMQFRIPVWTNYVFLPDSAYKDGTMRPPTTNIVNWEFGEFPAPQWVLLTTNKLRFFLFDGMNLVDAVGLAPMVNVLNVTKALHELDRAARPLGPFNPPSSVPPVWKTNRDRGAAFTQIRIPTEGVLKQLEISQTTIGAWDDFGVWKTSENAAQGFREFLASTNATSTNKMMAPYTPQHKVYQRTVWQANDPLVHHIAQDLRFTNATPPEYSKVSGFNAAALVNINATNQAYRPWGGNAAVDPSDPGRSSVAYDGTVKDPLLKSSDDWDFPTNRFPTRFANIGLLGKVHRGTPWQTIYLKAPPADMATWTNNHASLRSHPTNDWRLMDIFTVAQHPNASRGRLSVNQTNVAAWSALLSGIKVPTLVDSNGTPAVIDTTIEPVLNEIYVNELVEAINDRRQQLPGQVFASLSEFLTVTNLTVNSPYLRPPYVDPNVFSQRGNHLKDSDYEAIPQKALSLAKPGEARFVIFVFGQSLKPAPQSVVPGGNFRGLCLNYEVTGEMAAKAVMRVDLLPISIAPGVRPQAVIESFNLLPPD